MNWITASLIVAATSGVSVLLLKLLHLKHGQRDIIFFMYSLLFCGILAGAYLAMQPKRESTADAVTWTVVGILAIIFFAEWFFFTEAIRKAPNAGYAVTVININAVVTVLFSAILFGEHLTWRTLVGAVLATIGVSMMVNASRV